MSVYRSSRIAKFGNSNVSPAVTIVNNKRIVAKSQDILAVDHIACQDDNVNLKKSLQDLYHKLQVQKKMFDNHQQLDKSLQAIHQNVMQNNLELQERKKKLRLKKQSLQKQCEQILTRINCNKDSVSNCLLLLQETAQKIENLNQIVQEMRQRQEEKNMQIRDIQESISQFKAIIDEKDLQESQQAQKTSIISAWSIEFEQQLSTYKNKLKQFHAMQIQITQKQKQIKQKEQIGNYLQKIQDHLMKVIDRLKSYRLKCEQQNHHTKKQILQASNQNQILIKQKQSLIKFLKTLESHKHTQVIPTNSTVENKATCNQIENKENKVPKLYLQKQLSNVKHLKDQFRKKQRFFNTETNKSKIF